MSRAEARVRVAEEMAVNNSRARARLAATRPAAAARLPRTLTRAQPSFVTSAAATGAMKADAATWCEYF